VFSSLPCTDPGETTTICGAYGGFDYFGLSYRDTDWYQIELAETSSITWCATGEDDTLVGIIDGRSGCPVSAFYDYTIADVCTSACVNASLPAGTWWLFVATMGFGVDAVPCGRSYVAELTGYDCGTIAVESATWGQIKDIYR
jgi:hypothetical protein